MSTNISTIFQEKTARSLLKAILFLFIINLLWNLGGALNRSHQAQELLLTQDRFIASSLLDLGVSEEIVAKALTSTDTTPGGTQLLAKLGLHEHTSPWYFSALSTYSPLTPLLSLLPLLLFYTLFLAALLRYLLLQNRLHQKAMETISAYTAGRFDTPLPETKDGSLYRLFGAINHMAAALKTGQEAEHRTKEFLKNTISDISHQLKTPLAALSMYNEILLEEPDHPDTVRTFAQKSEASIERMKSLTLSLLKIARLDAGGISFQKIPCPLSRLLTEALDPLSWRLTLEKKQILLPTTLTETICCDPTWTTEALGTLLKNALDHTSEGDQITIHIEQGPLETRIHITDNGSGIPPSDLYHIFKRFYRSPATHTPGIGLGLPLAKAIAEGQGGTLTAQSPPGSGATFTLTLPTMPGSHHPKA